MALTQFKEIINLFEQIERTEYSVPLVEIAHSKCVCVDDDSHSAGCPTSIKHAVLSGANFSKINYCSERLVDLIPTGTLGISDSMDLVVRGIRSLACSYVIAAKKNSDNCFDRLIADSLKPFVYSKHCTNLMQSKPHLAKIAARIAACDRDFCYA